MLFLVLSGCSQSPGGPSDDAGASADVPVFVFVDPLDPSDASLASRVSAVFVGTCAGGSDVFCHARGAGGVHLRITERDAGDVVGVPSDERPELSRVKPGAPDESYLYLKVLGDGGIEGGRMPLGRERFDPRLPALVSQWIEAGAPSP